MGLFDTDDALRAMTTRHQGTSPGGRIRLAPHPGLGTTANLALTPKLIGRFRVMPTLPPPRYEGR